jgi:autotransporter-associated beta strand protein
VKDGTGTLVLSGTNTYSGSTTINGGTLEVDGSITGTSGLTVNAGGALSGTGTIDPPLPITIGAGATLTPGIVGVPGSSLNLAGNLTLSPGSFYSVYLNPLTSNFAAVTGTATLAGSNAIANFLPGNYISKKYTILTTAGGLGGTSFAGLTNVGLPSGASDTLSYDANNAYLNLKAGFTNYTGLSTNQQNVANTLTGYFNSNGGIPMRFFGLSPAGLTQVDGEVATGAERASFRLMDEFLTMMVDPSVDGRFDNGAAGGNGAMGFAPGRQAELSSDAALAYAKIFTKASPPPTFEQRWNVWGAGFGGSGKTGGNAAVGSNDTTLGTFGYAGGIDYHLSPETVVGVALAGGGSNWSVSSGLGGGRSDAVQAGAYSVTRAGAAYFAGSLAFANHWFSTDRTALGDNLHADFTGQVYGGRLEAGYRFAAAANLGITPYGAVQEMEFHSGSYSETDPSGAGFGLNYGANDASDARTELGARFDSPTLLNGMPLILRAKLAWAHDFVDTPSMNAAFQALPGTNFTVFGAPIPQNSALASLGAEWYLGNNWKLLAKFDGEFANNSDIYAGSIALRTSW